MQWSILLTVLAVCAVVIEGKKRFDHYKVYRIEPTNLQQLKSLHNLTAYESEEEFDFWTSPKHENQPIDLMVSPQKISTFKSFAKSYNLKYKTYVDDVQDLLDNELKSDSGRSFYRPNKFSFWTEYRTLGEIYIWLDSMAKAHSKNAKTVVGGSTQEGRIIKGMRINFGTSEKPVVFIEGGIHAREWISPATVTFLINALLTSEDPKVRQLAEDYEWYLFPSVNPDGYVYSHMNDRLWRKNRALIRPSFCRGIDLNRNWGYKWMQGGDDHSACSEEYAGKSAFSEVETRTLSKFITKVSDRMVAYLSFHSYSQVLLFPYGHTTEHLDNYDDEMFIANATIRALSKRYGTTYQTGPIAEAMYIATGNSIDWVKHTFKVPITFTYELRDTEEYGFLLPEEQIIPNGEEVLDSLTAMFEAAEELKYPRGPIEES